ncbi:MAG: YvcK family protein [Eubacteriaceae bacterium]|nr:YvcK family protein [Eubacteriaceae bacterium]
MFDLTNKKVTLIGGGTGNSVMLHSLRDICDNISVIVSVGDDGGSSGDIRRDFGTIPPGDIRNCLVALSDGESNIVKMMDTRFTQGFLKKQNLGNIMLTALYEITGSYSQAIKEISRLMECRGNVIPVTEQPVNIKARYKNGNAVVGESRLAAYALRHKTSIDSISLVPDGAKMNVDCVKAVIEADLIVFSPGSLYTSLLPNLAVTGLAETIEKSAAEKVYLPNIMSEPGETKGYTVSDFISAVERHSYGHKIIDTVIYNTSPIPKVIEERYIKTGAGVVDTVFTDEYREKYRLIGAPIARIEDGTVRHDGDSVWKAIEEEL